MPALRVAMAEPARPARAAALSAAASQLAKVERRQAADEDDQQQSQQDYGAVAHQASGLAISPLPVRLNARDGLDVAARFPDAPITKIRMSAKGFYG